ncbi:transposase [Microbulbifer echini]|uniref:Transposase n=1 Tax=Microbulbifer echini TaxID=1529067 RepID=A0ABV4NN37_9GAMM
MLNKVRSMLRKSNVGRNPFDNMLVCKALVLQHLYNQPDEQLEYQIRDRFTFCWFVCLDLEDRTPDTLTIWLFCQ